MEENARSELVCGVADVFECRTGRQGRSELRITGPILRVEVSRSLSGVRGVAVCADGMFLFLRGNLISHK